MNAEIEFTIIHCANCHMPFALTKNLERRLRECHNTFYCPIGHGQNFDGMTEKERLEEIIQKKDKVIAELKKKKPPRKKMTVK